jgi:hypothetical protein
MKKILFTVLTMIVTSAHALAAHSHTTLDCAFTMGPMPYLNSQLDVTGPEQFGSTLVFLSVDGDATESVSANLIPTADANEQERFALDETGNTAFDTLVIYKADPSTGISQAKLLMRPNAVSGEFDGTCHLTSAN